jgi:hypothetical protein
LRSLFFDKYTLIAYIFGVRGIFVESNLFEKYRDNDLPNEQYRELQNELLSNPKKGDVIQSTGELRKIRVASKSKEK